MDEIMTPSEMTNRQINKAVANYRAMLEKHASQFPSISVQQVLGSSGLAKKQFELFRELVEAESKTVTRSAPVNRTRTQMEALKATGRVQYVNEAVAIAIPTCIGDHVEMLFVNLGRTVACNKLDSELEKMGFELIVDPVGLAAINEDDPAFADTHPNGTQWKDADGNYCCAVFRCWDAERRVRVRQDDLAWLARWWFPVRRK